MISYVAKVIHLFALTIHYVINIASLTGKFIITLVTWVVCAVYRIFESVNIFLQIVYEDNMFIFTEVPNSIKGAMDSSCNQLMYFQDILSTVYNDTYDRLTAIITTSRWTVNAIIVMISEVLLLLRNSIIFLGDTLWLLITFIPVHLPQLLRSVINYMADALVTKLVDTYMALLKITNFLTEVPLESFIGITSAIVIVRVCVYFREPLLSQIFNVYWSLLRIFLYLYYAFYNYFNNSEVEVITRIARGDDVGMRQVSLGPSSDEDVNSMADALCVVCQERQKCVLTLPCRHICLCTDCCRRLYGYQRTCPICRTFIYHSVTVYL